MSISSRQIGWGTEENLLWQISKQLERLTQVTASIDPITTLTTIGTSGVSTLVGATLNIPNYSDGGVLSLSAIGSVSNANGGTITGTVLNLEPASASFGGVITTGTQAFEGDKTFNKDLIVNTLKVGLGGGQVSLNTALGVNALLSNTTGQQNTATGYEALRSNTTPNFNTANGYRALYANSTGASNTADGHQALYENTTGSYNTACGANALRYNTTGSYNTALGQATLVNNTTGTNNTATGYGTLFSSTGNSNTGNGYYALRSNTTGSNNVAIGQEAGYGTGVNANTTGTNNIFIGKGSVGVSSTASNRTWIGNASTTSTYLAGNVLIGTTTDVASSKLTISSTTQGFLPPRMTNAERIAITSPAIGLIVYCTDIVEGVYVNKSTGWVFIG